MIAQRDKCLWKIEKLKDRTLTAGVVGMAQPQLQTGRCWVLLAAIRRVHQQPEVMVQRVQQCLNQRVIGLVWTVHQILLEKKSKTNWFFWLFCDPHFSEGPRIRELDFVMFCHYSLLKINSTYFSSAMISIQKKLTPSFIFYSSFR